MANVAVPKAVAVPTEGHVSLGAPLRGLLFFVPVAAMAAVLYVALGLPKEEAIPKAVAIEIIWAILVGIFVNGVRVAAQWERGVVLRLGSFHSVKGPGVLYIIPFLDFVRFIDTRVLVLNIPSQKVITKDNVPAQIDGALFFLVKDAEKVVIQVQDFRFAISQYAQAALRDVVGGLSLDELLSERERIQERIRTNVEERIREWGLHVDSIRLLDIDLPEELKKMMSRQASAEREKRATITKAEGDKLAAENLTQAARTMSQMPGAMQLRCLQTIDGLGPTSSNTVVLFPMEWIQGLRALADGMFLTAPGAESSALPEVPPASEQT